MRSTIRNAAATTATVLVLAFLVVLVDTEAVFIGTVGPSS